MYKDSDLRYLTWVTKQDIDRQLMLLNGTKDIGVKMHYQNLNDRCKEVLNDKIKDRI